MNCPVCGAPVKEGTAFCESCGANLGISKRAAAPAAIVIPKEYKPLGPWAYIGWSLVYSIPIVGFIFLIVNSFRKDNLNRRNYTRSYWCALLIVLILLALTFGIAAATGSMDELMQIFENSFEQAQSGLPY